ncbi:MAG: ParA family protein, partial [Candidatus Eisenbacteria bacterium]|nr:ParA family protein [Candidatus Eisenbacteria bacterium]
MRVLSITNQKGGCGKTTTAVHLAACLAAKGHSTLLVDLDPQGHAGLALGIGGAKPLEASTYEVLTRRQPLEAILHEVSERLAVAPSDVRLSAVEQELSGVEGREYRLSEALASLEQNRFPFVVIDTPPSIGLLTFNALIASPEVLVPIDGSIFSLQGLDRLRETIAIVDRHVGRATTVRALATIYDRRTRLAREVLEEIRTRFGDWALHTVIHETVKLREAASQGKSILEICPSSIAADDHHSLAAELLQAATRRGTRTEAVSPAFSLHGGAPVTPAAALAPKVAACLL